MTGHQQSATQVFSESIGQGKLTVNSNPCWIRWTFIYASAMQCRRNTLRDTIRSFLPFHNPIEIEIWAPYTKKNFSIDRKNVRILYSGRIGDNGIAKSILEVASAIDSMNDNEVNIKLNIQTPTTKMDILDKLRKYKCVVINDFADYSKIPANFFKC